MHKKQTGNISVPRETGEPKGVFQKPENENICLTNLNVENNGNFPILAFGDGGGNYLMSKRAI